MDSRNRLKILAIIPSPYVFGLQNITLDYFKYLSECTNSHFLLTHWSDGELARRLDALNVPYSYSWLGMFSRKLDWDNLRMTIHCASKLPVLYRDYRKLIADFKPDVIYTANHHELLLLLPVLLTTQRPVVCHVHDPAPASPFYQFVARFYNRVVTHYIAISKSVQTRVEQLGINASKISLLYNGINLSRFPQVVARSNRFLCETGWGEECILIGMTGQMAEFKGHLDLIKAFASLSKEFPQIRLVIGGKTTGEYFAQLRDTIRALDLDQCIYFSGWQQDVKDFFAGIDIFVLPSRHEEGFGLVIAEAMATGLPVVATRSGGASELVEDGVSGLLVDKCAPNQLAEALQNLILSPEKRQAMSYAGRIRVEFQFNLSSQAQKFEQVLSTVVEKYG